MNYDKLWKEAKTMIKEGCSLLKMLMIFLLLLAENADGEGDGWLKTLLWIRDENADLAAGCDGAKTVINNLTSLVTLRKHE